MDVRLLAAVDDPKLLGRDFAPYPRQRALLGDLEGDAHIHVWALGRRSGKSTLAGVACLHNALFRPDLDALVRPGERRNAVAVATNISQARLIVDAARSIAERSALLAPLIEGGDKDSILFRLPSGARTGVRAFPCTARGVRGFAISALVFDELAHFLTDAGDAAAERVWQALVPATATFGSAATIVACSTPWGDDGLFAELFTKASVGALPGAVARQATTAEMNPTVSAAFLDTERQRDPVGFAAEYEAQFLGSGGAYLDFSQFEVVHRPEALPSEGTMWVAGLDPATERDPFGVALVGRSVEHPRHLVIGPVLGLRASGDFRLSALLDQVVVVCKSYGASAVTDQYLAPAVVEHLRSAGIAVATKPMTAESKTLVYGELRARLYDGTVELRDDPGLVGELRRLRAQYSAGRSTVSYPRSGPDHGDRAQALTLAVWRHTAHGVSTGVDRLGHGRDRRNRPLTAGLLDLPL